MKWIALIDATHHTHQAPPGRVVAGLTLLERAVRLAATSDCSHAVVAAKPEFLDEVEAICADIDFDIELLVRACEADDLGSLVVELSDTLGPLIEASEGLLYVRSSTVYDRGMVGACDPPDTHRAAVTVPDLPRSGVQGRDALAPVFKCSRDNWERLLEVCRDDAPADVAELAVDADAARCESDGWQVRVEDDASADEAAEKLWNSCRKSVDGVVSRYLNRHISLAISRKIAATGIKPNHISVVTFSLGAIAAIFAGIGGYMWFVLAGLAYQLNSIVDGVDGELARVKYEFSLLGEWLDTLSDDTKDVLFYGGLGIGAWRTWEFPIEGLGPDTWLWLGAVAVVGKLVSMVAYYTWLIAHKRGDLLAFEWSFEDEDNEPSALSSAMANLKYLTKNDFICFAAMWMAFLGALPYFLFVVAPGQFFIATSVLIQRVQRKRAQRAAASDA
ncbi:MAG: CDP-alcohol phosphatidyltransferase family protein [Persicimonas sp.]